MIALEQARKRLTRGGSSFELHVPALQIAAGQMVAIVGDSGCGKSTLLDMLALIMAPTQVQRFELDFPLAAQRYDVAQLWAEGAESALAGLRRRHLGYVLQTGGLLPFLSVRDNVLLPARIKGVEPVNQRLNDLAERLGLSRYLDRPPDALSIGQRQRAAILRALVHGPDLLLADEPTAAVDKLRARQIMDDLQALARDAAVAVVVVTHDLELIAGRADGTYTFDTEQVSATETRSLCRPLSVG